MSLCARLSQRASPPSRRAIAGHALPRQRGQPSRQAAKGPSSKALATKQALEPDAIVRALSRAEAGYYVHYRVATAGR
eukprot:9602160-Heterocapsa_arctica.AAC.1